MSNETDRRTFIAATSATLLAAAGVTLSGLAVSQPSSALRRIKIATVGAPDVAELERWYVEWLRYQVVERGKVGEALASSWGAPASAGRDMLLLAPENGGDVYIRAVEIDPVPDYRPMTSFGWNSIEIIVDDVYALSEALEGSPFKVIGEPHSLGGGFASIHAMQVVGPAQEVLYLTCETGDREKSTLPLPGSFVDRPFIMILAGPDIEAMAGFYVDHFAMARIPNFTSSLSIASRAMNLPPDYVFTLGLLRGRERGNNIELDEYPASAGDREHREGQLPPGVAMTSFSVDSLDGFDLPFISPPQALYGDARAATFVGPAGELTELIEDPAAN